MKSYKQQKTVAIFFLSNLYLKQDIGLVYIMVDFICMSLLELQGTQSKQEIQNEKFLPTVRFKPGTFYL